MQLVVGGITESVLVYKELMMSTRREYSESVAALSSPIRRRFALWSLTVVGALSSTGMVCLQPSAAWGYDDPAAEKKGDEAEKKTEEVFNREVFSKLLSGGKMDEAATKLDAAIADAPDDMQLWNMELQLAMMLGRSNADESKKRLAALNTKLMAKDKLDLSASMLLMQATTMRVQSDRTLNYEDQLTLIDEAVGKIKSSAAEDSPVLKSLMQTKVRVMVQADKETEAKSLLDAMIEEALKSIDSEKPATISAYSSVVALYNLSLKEKFPSETKAVIENADKMLQARMADEKATLQDFMAYINMKGPMASSLVYSDPKLGVAMVADIEKAIEAAKERFDEKSLAPLSMLERNLKSTKTQLERAMLREELLGTQAPAINAEHFVGTQPVSMDDLQGKVVLLDFWAVWCGPCIATFPHLIEWHEKYADKGLVILGSTNFYNYKWDDEAGKAVRGESEGSVTPEEELAMLEKFRESYKLHHGFFVNGKGSDYAASFAVSGIPQAVLLDKQGKIQMIRVGSGEANAKALEAKIEELLAQ